MKTAAKDIKNGMIIKSDNIWGIVLGINTQTEKEITFDIQTEETIIKHRGCKPHKLDSIKSTATFRVNTMVKTK